MYEDHDRRHDTESRERIAVLETEIRLMGTQLREIAINLQTIRDTLAEAKGGWKVFIMVCGSAGIIGAFIGRWLAIIVGAVPK